MFNTPEFKVGALVVIVSGLIGTMSMKVSEGPGFFSGTKKYYFDVPDAEFSQEDFGKTFPQLKIEQGTIVNAISSKICYQSSLI